MKKLLSALFVLFTLAVGMAAVYLSQKPADSPGSTVAVAYLPADTLVLLAIPDLNKTCADWKTTDLYKIWAEPDVQAFLARPLAKLPPHAELDAALAKADKLGLSNLFVALASLDENTSQPHIVAGFEFKGASTDVDELLAKPKAELRKQYPASKADLVDYEGHAIETVVLDEHSSLASVYLGDWYLVSNDLTLLKATLDRAEHRGAAASQPTLDKDPDYAAVMAKLPAGRSTLIFSRAKPFLTRIFDLAAASGQPVDPTQRAEAEKVRAIGASTGFENGKIRDAVYVYAPGISQELATLQSGALGLTTADTVLYAAGVLRIPQKFDLPAAGAENGGANPPALAFMRSLGDLGAKFKEHDITLDSFRAAFGNEVSLQLDWAAAQAQPTLIASLDVHDPAAAAKFVDRFTAALSGDETWETTEAGGLKVHSLDLPNVPGLAPTLAVTSHHLLLGLNIPEVRDAAARETANAPNFTAGEVYKTAVSKVGKPNTTFAYLDTRAFFERLYGTLKPYALTASFLLPQVNDYVDLGKLPEVDTVARHLSPTVLSQTYNPDGCLVESVGSFTFGEAAVVLVGGSLGAATAFIPKTGAEEVDAAPAGAAPSSTP